MRVSTELRSLIALCAILFLPLHVAAAELALPGDLPALQLHGFVSQGFLATSANHYLARTSIDSFEFYEVAFNFTLPATYRLMRYNKHLILSLLSYRLYNDG